MMNPRGESNRAAFTGLLIAGTISLIGSRMTMVALPWLVLVTTGSAAKTGVIGAAELLPYVLACAFGPPLIDRIGGRRVSIVADALSLVAVGAIPLLYEAGRLSFPAFAALVAVTGALRGFSDSAKNGAIFPQAVAEAGVEMTRATSLDDGLNRTAGLIGSLAAGVLVVWLGGAARVLLIDAVSFGLCAILVAVLVRLPGKARDAGAPEPYHRALLGGLRYLRGDRLTLALIVMLFVTNMLDQGFFAVLLPLWAHDLFDSPVGISIVAGAFSVGAVLGNIAFTILAPRLPRWAPFAIGFLIAGAPRFAVLAFDAPTWMIIAITVLQGLGAAALNPILGAVFYERIPERLQTRVLGLSTAVAYAGMPLGTLLCGWLGELGVKTALLAVGAVYLLTTLAPFVGGMWREMDRRPAAQATPEPVPASA